MVVTTIVAWTVVVFLYLPERAAGDVQDVRHGCPKTASWTPWAAAPVEVYPKESAPDELVTELSSAGDAVRLLGQTDDSFVVFEAGTKAPSPVFRLSKADFALASVTLPEKDRKALCDGTTVNVTVREFAVLPAKESAPAGYVRFAVTNTGPEDTHEFVVFKTDLEPDALPTASDGSVDEEGEGVELIDEIEDIAVGDSPHLTVSLDAGSYVLICNIVEKEGDEKIVHYQQGMRMGFTVE
jgi:uncharacterized cupredoxin-like copper-binding protein